MPGWKQKIEACLAAGQPVCRIVIAEAKGSTPREAGADMYVTKQGIRGTIGGGTLEFEAMAYARQILAELAANKTGDKTGFIRQFRRFAAGPDGAPYQPVALDYSRDELEPRIPIRVII